MHAVIVQHIVLLARLQALAPSAAASDSSWPHAGALSTAACTAAPAWSLSSPLSARV